MDLEIKSGKVVVESTLFRVFLAVVKMTVSH